MVSAVDTNIIATLWSGGSEADFSYEVIREARRTGRLIICSAVYAELVANPATDADFVDREAGARFLAHAIRRQR